MQIKECTIKDHNLNLEALEVYLDNTTLLIISGYGGFAMCGALDVDIYNTPKMEKRNVICFKAIGVKTIVDLFGAPIACVSNSAKRIGIEEGMLVKDAFEKMAIIQGNN